MRDPARLGERGSLVRTTLTVEQLLGRKARTFDEWLERHGRAFQ
ncbi:hypothetical protein [Sorangium sp. So ce131]